MARFRFFSNKQLLSKRVAGFHDIRLDGLSDLLLRARGGSVLDVGCNRGMVGFEFACNGADVVHGIDVYERGIETAREVFSDMLHVKSRFEVCDLTGGAGAIGKALGQDYRVYDFVLFLAVDHKLQRIMSQEQVNLIVEELGRRSGRFFAYRGRTGDIYNPILERCGLKRIHYSEIAEEAFGAPAIVWGRK